MPLITLSLDDELYRQLQEAASHKKVSILSYIGHKLKQPEWFVMEIDSDTMDRDVLTIQPAVASDKDLCGPIRSYLQDARQRLLYLSVFLGHPLAEIPTQKDGACDDAKWQAQQILAELIWLNKSLETEAYEVVDASRAIVKADPADDFDPFWMVVRDQGDGHAVSATERHTAMFLAEQEAERLCDKERKPFLIFHAVARCDAGPTPINWQLAKDHRP